MLRLKPEQRILALTVLRVRGNHRYLLGVVYRGSRWLDGVIFEPLGKRRSYGVAEIIRQSRYFKELRYVMLRRSNLPEIDGERLNEVLGLPVIKCEIVRVRMGKVESWGVTKEEAMAILHAFKSEKPEPEAVYLANLLENALEHQA